MPDVNGKITKVNNPGVGGKVEKDPPSNPPRVYPFTTSGEWAIDEKVIFELSNGHASKVRPRPKS